MARSEGRFPPQEEAVIKTVASRVREERTKAGLTQKQLADRLGRTQGYAYEIETGEANLTLRTLSRVADVLELDARDLLPEGRSGTLSLARLNQLLAVLERLAGILGDRQALEARRVAQEAEVLAELRALTDLRTELEKALKPLKPQTDTEEGG
jgi:transcriptional regulator with XRE-family HTH domain